MEEKLEAFLNYVNHHVLHHWGTLDAITHRDWLVALGKDVLAIFHFDATMVIFVAASVGRLFSTPQ